NGFADHRVALNDRQMANPFGRDDSHTIVYGMVRAHGHHRTRHDVPDRGVLRGFSVKHDFAGVITLGNDADHRLAVDHDQRSDVFFGHQPDGLEYRFGRAHRPDVVPLVP